MPDQLLQWVELGSEPGVAPGPLERAHALERLRGDPRLAPELDPPQQLVRHGHLP